MRSQEMFSSLFFSGAAYDSIQSEDIKHFYIL